MVKALVTGVSGYVASHLAKLLVIEGHEVRGTVRSLDDKEKVSHLQKEIPNVQLIEADLLSKGSFDKAVEGCEWVFHTASPFFHATNNPQIDLVEPALNGTLNVLNSVEKSGTVKRVILTSSVAAVASFSKPIDYIYSDKDWNLDGTIEKEPYRFSKRVAEEAAWEFSKGKKWDLVVINPTFVIGPPLSSRSDSTSVKTVRDLLNGTAASKGYGGPNAFPCVDVRDVAKSHLLAAQNPKSSGRYLLGSPNAVSHFEFCQILINSGVFSKYPIPTKEFTPVSRRVLIDNSRVIKELGLEYTSVEKSLVDMGKSLIEFGIVNAIASAVAPHEFQ